VNLRFSRHAYSRMLERCISVQAVAEAVRSGEVVESYPGAHPLPCKLVLCHTLEGPVHVLMAEDQAEHAIIVVTVYRPDLGRWHEGFRRRR
jgi:hypothetical protein